ncbi:glycerate kinase [uncultured Dialister sp.]|uniref:glycerate kinase family protein n=1 Tax=uncultured Dialister sp. TaxID=278064 RepID=UPI00263789FD|nr:glycerate kinase [uncultured Dialister sp.]
MHIIIAPDSFKGTLSSLEAGTIIKEAARSVFPASSVDVLPMADGGEGTVEAVLQCTAGEKVFLSVRGPLGEPVNAFYGRLSGNRAIMEMAEASGLMLVPEEKRNPLLTSTFGTGEMMARAMEAGARTIILGIGGSATCDGGMGAMEALGIRFLDKEGRELPGRGASLRQVEAIEFSRRHPLLAETEVIVLSDVKNPLCGERGAARAFAPQKGADSAMVEELEKGMVHYRNILEETFGKNADAIPGSGAAGGLGAALALFLHGRMVSGAEEMLRIAGFDKYLQDADLVVTGEGRSDGQSGEGKITGAIANRCRKWNVPCAVLSGSLGEGWETLLEQGAFSVCGASSGEEIEKAMKEPGKYLRKAAEDFFRKWRG